MDSRSHFKLRSPIYHPLSFTLTFPIVDWNSGQVVGAVRTLLFPIRQVVEAHRVDSVVQVLFPIRQQLTAGMEAFGTATSVLPIGVFQTTRGWIGGRGQVVQVLRNGIVQSASSNVLNPRIGSIVQQLNRVVQSANGWRDITGTGAQTLGGARQFMDALFVPEGSAFVRQRLAGILQDVEGIISPAGQIAQTLPGIFQDAVGSWQPPAFIEQTLFAIQQAATGTAKLDAAVQQHLFPIAQHGLGSSFGGTAAQMLFQPTQRAIAFARNPGTIVQVLNPLSQASDGWVEAMGPAAQMLYPVQQDVRGFRKIDGTVSQRLFPVTQDAEGLWFFGLSGEQLLRTVFIRSVARIVNDGEAVQSLFPISQDSTGWAEVTGNASQTLYRFSQSAVSIHLDGTIAQTLAPVSQAAVASMWRQANVAQTLFGIKQQARRGTAYPELFAAETHIGNPTWPDFVTGIRADNETLKNTLALQALGF